MDANVLLGYFSATLEADQETRRQGELKLKESSGNPGFLAACLDVLSENDPNASGVKMAAAVFFKNRVIKYWPHKGRKIGDQERAVIKERILPVVINSDYNTKQQLVPVLRLLIFHDFSDWFGLLETTGDLLQQVPTGDVKDEDFSHLYTGLLCFAEIARKFRWVDNKDRKNDLYPIINSAFPHLLEIGNSIVANSQNITEMSSEVLKLILKIYKFVTYYDLPEPLQTREALIQWGEFHASVINMPPPRYVITSALTEQEKCFLQISKCYKWAVANLYRIFTRYSSKGLSKKFNYAEFYSMFLNEFIPHLLNNFLQIVEQWCNGERWLSSTAFYYLLEFFSHCVVEKSTWALLKPFYENLVSHLIFPLLIPSDQTLETFEEDPHEYIQLKFEINEGYDNSDVAALGLLVTLVDKRKKTTLNPIVTFIISQLSALLQQEETLELAKKKEAVLRMLGNISSYIVGYKSAYLDQLEQFLTSLVFPSLNSKFEFLRARTLEVSSRFADYQLKSEESKSLVFHGILTNFNAQPNEEVSLPVSFQSALAIQSYIQDPSFREILSSIILPTMSKLLELSNEIDNDAISMVMQECVENFSEQLQPFGVDLMTKLVQQFMKLAVEINEASNLDVDDFDGNYTDQGDKVMAATGLINTMITVLLSFENSREICIRLEEVFSPAIEYVLTNKLDDFLAEIGELMENSTFLLRSISPVMWKNFKLLCESFDSGIALMYLEELIQCLQNFLIYGQEDLAHNPQLVEGFFKIFTIISEGDDAQVGSTDLIYGCVLAQNFVLCLQHNSSTYIPQIIQAVLKIAAVVSEDKHHHIQNSSYDVNINNVLVASMIYDANTTLSILQEHQQLLPFFDRWFTLIPQLRRVFDLKLSILGIISLLSNGAIADSLGPTLVELFGHKFPILLKELPAAIENLENKRKNFNELEFTDNYKYGKNDWENASTDDLDEILNQGEAAATQEQREEETADTNEYLNFLEQQDLKLKGAGYFDEEDEQIIEDPLANTPLDNLDVITIFKEFVQSMVQDTEKYQLIFGRLSELDKRIIANIFDNVQ